MTNTRGAVPAPSGALVFKVCGWVAHEGCGLPVTAAVIATSRMDAVLRARAFGLRDVAVDVDEPLGAAGVVEAMDSPERAAWTAYGDEWWAPMSALPRA